ncbi:MAG: peptidase M19 [Gammaproteobacteria bacterium]|nr:peptidase M19 [Gammaproteobacteria bacterium]
MKAKRVFGIGGLLIVFIIALTFLFVPAYLDDSTNTVIDHTEYQISSAARELHKTLNIGDLHSDSTLWKRNLLERYNRGHVDIPRLREGNVAVQMFTSVTKVPAGINYEKNSSDANDRITQLAIVQAWPIATWTSLTARALHHSDMLHVIQKQAPDEFTLVRTVEDLNNLLNRRADGDAIVGGILGTEGSHALDGKLDNIDTLFDAGFRMMSLQHFFDNKLGGSLHGESGEGLTTFGREALVKMQAKDIMVDVSHSSPQVVKDVLAMSNKPLIVSHTGLHGHCPSKRNISDELMIKIAHEGGLIGVGHWEGAICEPTPKNIIKALRYGIDLLGEDHIALGSDFDGATATPFDTSELAILTEEMLKANFSETEIRKVMGENMMRFLRENLPQ